LGKVAVKNAHRIERLRHHCANSDRVSLVLKELQTSRSPTGTAMTIFLGFFLRKALTAARIVEPVAIPSSTMMIVLPVTSSGLRAPRYSRSRR